MLLGEALDKRLGIWRPLNGKAFEQNYQSYRVVEELERRYTDFPGLNLSWQALHGILKHHTAFDNPALPYPYEISDPDGSAEVKSKYFETAGCSVEAQIVNAADQIAWVTHDLEDALRVRFLTVEELRELPNPLLRKAGERALESASGWEKDRILWGRLLVRNMIDLLINDVLPVSSGNLSNFSSPGEIIARRDAAVDFSPGMADAVRDLREFLVERVYTNPVVERMSVKAAGILERLFKSLTKDLLEPGCTSIKLLPRSTQARMEEVTHPVAKYLVVVDFLAGMTDRFATEFYRVLYAPEEKSITSLY